MADRKKYQYAVITYLPNKIRNERVNIGVVLSDVAGSDAMIKIIAEHNNSKLRGLIQNKYEQKLYDSSVSYLQYCVDKINNNDLTFSNDSEPIKSIFNLEQTDRFPEGLILSKIRTITTANVEMLYSKIIDTYVGNEFFDVAKDKVIDLKMTILNEFNAKNLINTKVKHSFPIQPDKNVDWKINVDFAFSQKKQLNILQTVPTTESALDTWYPKIKTFTSDFGDESDIIYILSDLSQPINDDDKVAQMINSIGNNNRVKSIDVSQKSNSISNLTSTINQRADSIAELNKLLRIRVTA